MDRKKVLFSILLIFILLNVFMLVTLCGSANSSTSETGERVYRSITHNGLERTYHLYIPAGYNNKSLPLVMMFHGGLGTGELMEKISGMSDKATEENFIVAYPDGIRRTWNSGHCCGYALKNNLDDVGFITAMIKDIMNEYKINDKMIYAAGISNGAMFVHRLGAKLSDTIAAIAPVAGSVGGKISKDSKTYTPPVPDNPVSVIILHGKEDHHVKYEGGQSEGIEKNRIDLAVSDSVAYWVKVNECDSNPKTETANLDNVVIDTYTGGKNNTEVVLYTIINGGHEWFGDNRPPVRKISTTDTIWKFFSNHPKQ